ncbi:unnamed protein product [Durusdinium trenchii]|uniref:Uncharacterized protein n=1 Tax=Durusdinium trenchii TaxID=1381693 RepID=A0ABP0MI57_9DINO
MTSMRMLLAALVVLLHSTQAFRELHSTAVQRFEEGPDETKEPDQGEEEPNQEAQVKELAPSEEEDDEEEEADQQEGQVGEDAGPGEQQDAEPVEEQDVEDLPAPVAAQKVRAKDMAEGDEGDPEELLNLEEFLPLCDKEIVEDTCRLLNEGEKHEEVEKYTTWQEIEQHLSADEKSLDRFRQITGIALLGVGCLGNAPKLTGLEKPRRLTLGGTFQLHQPWSFNWRPTLASLSQPGIIIVYVDGASHATRFQCRGR